MAHPRLAVALVLPPNCIVCLSSTSGPPGWTWRTDAVCEACWRDVLTLFRDLPLVSLAALFDVDGVTFTRSIARAAADAAGTEAEAHADLGIAYSELGMTHDAETAWLVAMRIGGEPMVAVLFARLVVPRLADASVGHVLRDAIARSGEHQGPA